MFDPNRWLLLHAKRARFETTLDTATQKSQNPCAKHLPGSHLLSPWSPEARLFANDLDQHPLPASPVELTVEYLLARALVRLPIGDRHHHFAAHDLALHLGIGVVPSFLSGQASPVRSCRYWLVVA